MMFETHLIPCAGWDSLACVGSGVVEVIDPPMPGEAIYCGACGPLIGEGRPDGNRSDSGGGGSGE